MNPNRFLLKMEADAYISRIKKGSLKREFAEALNEWYRKGCPGSRPYFFTDEIIPIKEREGGGIGMLECWQAMFKSKRNMCNFFIVRTETGFVIRVSKLRYHDEEFVLDELSRIYKGGDRNGKHKRLG